MKNIIITLITIFSIHTLSAQTINWKSSTEDQTNLVFLSLGYDFALTTQFGYGLQLNTSKPIILTADYSFPMGNKIVDDFKIRLGGQILLLEKDSWLATAKVYGIFRRHQTKLVKMASFGSEFSAQFGYYKPKWSVSAEIGFDKSIVTHLKHSDILRDNYQEIQDGWFIPSGGHFFYGMQGSKTLGSSWELYLSLGATNAQSDDENALLPFYGRLGVFKKF